MKKLNIIYEDKELLVIDKPSGQYTIGTEKDKFNSLYHEVREYIRKKNQKVFIVNRLDKDTSGIVVFAKNEALKSALQNNWNNNQPPGMNDHRNKKNNPNMNEETQGENPPEIDGQEQNDKQRKKDKNNNQQNQMTESGNQNKNSN